MYEQGEQGQVAEQPVAPIAESTPAPLDEGTASPPADAAADESQQEGEQQQPKPRGGFQRRIDELTRRHSEAERRAEAAEAASRQLIAVLQRQVGAPPQQQQPQAAQGPSPEQYQTWDDYQRALARHEAEQAANSVVERRLAQAREAEQARFAQQQSQKAVETFTTRLQKTAAEIPDFEETIAGSTAPATPQLQAALVTNEHGPRLMYELARQPEIAARLSRLPMPQMMYELGKLEKAVVGTPPQVSNAPPPPKTAKGGTEPPDPLSMSMPIEQWAREFIKRRHSR